MTDEEEYSYNKAERGTKNPIKKRAVRKQAVAIQFEQFSHLPKLCRRLESCRTESELWREDGTWWLLLTATSELGFIKEYGTVHDAQSIRTLLGERGECICARKAVEQMAKL